MDCRHGNFAGKYRVVINWDQSGVHSGSLLLEMPDAVPELWLRRHVQLPAKLAWPAGASFPVHNHWLCAVLLITCLRIRAAEKAGRAHTAD